MTAAGLALAFTWKDVKCLTKPKSSTCILFFNFITYGLAKDTRGWCFLCLSRYNSTSFDTNVKMNSFKKWTIQILICNLYRHLWRKLEMTCYLMYVIRDGHIFMWVESNDVELTFCVESYWQLLYKLAVYFYMKIIHKNILFAYCLYIFHVVIII